MSHSGPSSRGSCLPIVLGKATVYGLIYAVTTFYILGLTTDGEGYMKYAGNELEYTLSDLSVHISNNAIASGRSEGLSLIHI